MKRPSGRMAGVQTRQEWTARLQRFAEAQTREEKRAVFDHAQQINPGGTIRSMLEAWGYSASGRGRKKAREVEHAAEPARSRLETALREIYGRQSSPVASLYPKLAGIAAASVQDAGRIVAALIHTWPEPLTFIVEAKNAEERRRCSRQMAEELIRTLLAELSGERSWDWRSIDIEEHGFKLTAEERIGIVHFIKDAANHEGAWIVASTKGILVADNPVNAIRNFHRATQEFVEAGAKGLLIFVLDAGIFHAGENRFDLLYNLGQLTSAITAFALFQGELEEMHTVKLYKVDWSRWQGLAARCCLVMRRPPLIDPTSGELLASGDFDDFIAEWLPPRPFSRLKHVDPIIEFTGAHVLPEIYPPELHATEALSGKDLHWNVTVRPCVDAPDGLKVEFFIPPAQSVAPTLASDNGKQATENIPEQRAKRGRRRTQYRAIEGDSFYVIRCSSPGLAYERAQRAIYMASRARLLLDSGDEHERNLIAAAALRHLGFEVLPLSVAISLLPRSLHYAAGRQQSELKKKS
jgi:hypothetical protein